MNFKLPIYTMSKEIIERRQNEYLNILNKGYAKASRLTPEEYEEIKKIFEYDRNDALDILIEKSIGLIVDAVAYLYAKHDLDNIIPVEDALQECVITINDKVRDFNILPHFYSEYAKSYMNYMVYVRLHRLCDVENEVSSKVDFYSNNDLSYIVDKEKNEKLDTKTILLKDFRKALKKAEKELTEQEKMIISLRFGLETGEELTTQDIAAILGLSRARICDAILRSLRKLREPYSVRYLKDYANLDMDL
ncbi:MAG: sigma-70 family RNA polymerase sigma factor [Clostridia bacterium]|nr:sigma-70 family RNA polymerase sigma factor [Clostridia bacterium]